MTDRKALAWIGVFDGEPDPEFIWWDEAKARRWINTRPGVELAPLAIAPPLTDAEREALEATIVDLDGGANFNEQRFWPMLAKRLRERSATLRGLLERLGPKGSE